MKNKRPPSTRRDNHDDDEKKKIRRSRACRDQHQQQRPARHTSSQRQVGIIRSDVASPILLRLSAYPIYSTAAPAYIASSVEI